VLQPFVLFIQRIPVNGYSKILIFLVENEAQISPKCVRFYPFEKFQYDIYHCCVYSEELLMTDKRNCPNHVKFYSQNKFEKLVHLVWIYYNNLSRYTVT